MSLLLTLVAGGAATGLLFWLDRRRLGRSRPGILFVFPLVGLLSLLPGFVLYSWAGLWAFEVLGGTGGLILFIWAVNAPVEELAKYLCFAAAARGLHSIREPQDGSLQGAATGLGFGLGENFLYGLAGGWELVLLRTLFSLPGHMIYGAVWGGYHGFEVYQGRGRVQRWWVPLAALVPAIAAHAAFNTLVVTGVPLGWALLVDGVALGFGAFLFAQFRSVSPTHRARPLKEWQNAIPELEHALILDPASPILRQRLAAYLLVGNQAGRALTTLANLPDEPWTQFYRLAARRRLGQDAGPPPEEAALNPRLFRLLSGG